MFCDSVILSVQSYAFRVLEHDNPMHKRELICVSKNVSLILVCNVPIESQSLRVFWSTNGSSASVRRKSRKDTVRPK